MLDMLEVSGVEPLVTGYLAPACRLAVRASSRLSHPGASVLRRLVAMLEAGAELTWSRHHGDEGLFVVAGSIEVEGMKCGAGGSTIVAAGVATTVRAVVASHLIHTGSVQPDPPTSGPFGAPRADNHGVH